MSDSIKARFVGHPDGISGLVVPLANGETARIDIKHGGELPSEIGGVHVPAIFRDSLLEQTDNWTEVRRDPPKPAAKTAPSGEEGDK